MTTSSNPAIGGSVAPASGWYDAGASFWVTASPNTGYQLTGFTPGGDVYAYEVTMNGPISVTANFTYFTGQKIISNPPGAVLTVDGLPCPWPCQFQWATGDQHTIGAASPQSMGTGTQLIFSGWSDGGAQSHNIIASAGTTYTANFRAQYYLTTSVNSDGGGAITPPSGWHEAAESVTISATADPGHPFTGFTGALSGTVTPQTLVMIGPATVSANFMAVPTDLPVSALPPSQTVAPGAAASYTVTVATSAGFGGTVALTTTGLPPGTTASFSPSALSGSGASNLTITSGAATPLGVYPITVAASAGSLTQTTMVSLEVVAPAPANMISPSSGSNLNSGPATFTWDAGLGVSQYQLSLGTAPGASDLYQGGPGTNQSAAVTLANTDHPQTVYGDLKSLIAGTWQTQSYSYTLNPLNPNVVGSTLNFSSGAYTVNAGGGQSQAWSYCVTTQGSSCASGSNTFDAGSVSSCQVLQPVESGYINDPYVSAQIKAKGMSSSGHQKNMFDVAFTATSNAAGGSRRLNCTYSSVVLSLDNALRVYNAPPRITAAQQFPPAYPGGPFYEALYGYGFGKWPGRVTPCVFIRGAFGLSPACTPDDVTPDLQVTQANSDGSAPPGAPYAYWSDNQINVLLTPTSNASGNYDLVVNATFVENGNQFNPNPQDAQQGQSNRQAVYVTAGPPTAQIKMGSAVVSGNAANSPKVVSVGQKVVLDGIVSGLPAGVTIATQLWTVEGATVASYVQTQNYATQTNSSVKTSLGSSDLQKPHVAFYWVDGDRGKNDTTYTVSFAATLSDQTQIVARAGFRPIRPSPVVLSGATTKTEPAINIGSQILGVAGLNFGYAKPDYGISVTFEVTTTFGGSVALLQLLNSTRRVTPLTGPVQQKVTEGYVLDDVGYLDPTPQYSGADGIFDFSPNEHSGSSVVDMPALQITDSSAASASEQFKMYLTYKPPGSDSIWVTLGVVEWNWNGSASLVNGSWVLSAGNTYAKDPAGNDSIELPEWSKARTFFSWQPVQ